MDLTSLAVNGIPLMVLIFGLVEFIKSLGLSGKPVTALSLVLGVLFGVGYAVSTNGMPADFAGWFGMGVFSLTLGLGASGFYKFAAARWPTIR
jgi:hypothetical protein